MLSRSTQIYPLSAYFRLKRKKKKKCFQVKRNGNEGSNVILHCPFEFCTQGR